MHSTSTTSAACGARCGWAPPTVPLVFLFFRRYAKSQRSATYVHTYMYYGYCEYENIDIHSTSIMSIMRDNIDIHLANAMCRWSFSSSAGSRTRNACLPQGSNGRQRRTLARHDTAAPTNRILSERINRQKVSAQDVLKEILKSQHPGLFTTQRQYRGRF